MVNYAETKINLSPKQRQSIAHAVQHKVPIRLKFSYAQLNGNNAKIHLTMTQHNKIQKAKMAHKGIMLTLSKKQLEYHQKGGFLPMLLAGLASALAPTLFNRLFPEKHEGSGLQKCKVQKYEQDDNMNASGINMPAGGINMPNGHGINLPSGYGAPYNHNNKDIRPANGENTQYHLSGNHTSYLPDSYQNVHGYDQHYKALPNLKVKRGKGLGDTYMNPQSEKFQMLH